MVQVKLDISLSVGSIVAWCIPPYIVGDLCLTHFLSVKFIWYYGDSCLLAFPIVKLVQI